MRARTRRAGAAARVVLACAAGAATPAHAHVAEQALVLLMPTDVYIGVGTVVVALTALLLPLLPHSAAGTLLASRTLGRAPRTRSAGRAWPSLVSTAVLGALLAIGVFGPHDPLENLLPLSVWTLWWMLFTALHALLGDLWRRLNPWSGILRLLGRRAPDDPGVLRLPQALGAWPGVLLFVGFTAFALADPAPADPPRLAAVVAAYWTFTLAMLWLFGESAWFARGECFAMVFGRFAALAPIARDGDGRRALGVPGHALAFERGDTGLAASGGAGVDRSTSAALFALVVLGCGSFDGLNETFFWLDLVGVNPLEYPGRSALVGTTLLGLGAIVLLLVLVFALSVALGRALVRGRGDAPEPPDTGAVLRALAPTVLPIALGYHVAHYLGSFLVDVQYALVALGDPLDRGFDPLGLGPHFVTTGFFNTPATVRLLWLIQATAVVGGHLLAVVLAHARALALFGTARRATLAQLPVIVFMVAYTLFGLWLLASPRGA